MLDISMNFTPFIMNAQTPPRRFALLVGVDLYQNNGSRKSIKHNGVSLKSFRGYVNDVRLFEEFLRHHFQLHENRRPTFENIKREFLDITSRNRPGHMFFSHFSGHGALLPGVGVSPAGRDEDPSLMTMDYCC
ncbi:uncharacterized protein BCR38DRAFT_411882 [Pseudomassariella vexata]|uniref:Peptidase C14 caspase domain-containing protein n=1 Tax=Pseudomassariella vexata TaxID=1141098 RepID=A0A1Y2DNM1_9PEZI|nr:uncharacterized protein BCR38DRAFT_411882 [Pseudomassariella vexata]ORY60764.1 hypothetical protein BCR38DRAFT_411882 [Pseudomassariella vexata]